MTTVSIREKRILTWKEATALIGRQVFEDCCSAGWLKPCAVKEGGTRDRRLFSRRDLETCEARMEQGEYPNPKGGRAA